jgi:hypothetical protein
MELVSDKTIVCYSDVQYLLSRLIPMHPYFLHPGWLVIKLEIGGGVFHNV